MADSDSGSNHSHHSYPWTEYSESLTSSVFGWDCAICFGTASAPLQLEYQYLGDDLNEYKDDTDGEDWHVTKPTTNPAGKLILVQKYPSPFIVVSSVIVSSL